MFTSTWLYSYYLVQHIGNDGGESSVTPEGPYGAKLVNFMLTKEKCKLIIGC